MSEKQTTRDVLYDRWLFGDKTKLTGDLLRFRERYDALSEPEKQAYLENVRSDIQSMYESRDVIEHPDRVDEFKNGPVTVKIYGKGSNSIVTGDCQECHQFPCKHTGADFTDKGLLKGKFPKVAST